MNVLAISAHPDDETLGCGGTLLKHSDEGDSLFWIIVTRPHGPSWSREVTDRKEAEVEKVAEAYGVQEPFWLGFPAIRLDTVPMVDLIDAIRCRLAAVRPDVIYMVHGGDVHTDHRIVYSAAMSVLKPFYMAGLGVKRVLTHETLSSTEATSPSQTEHFVPTVFNDITAYVDRKIEIMELYESELQPDPLPRGPTAIRALARYRGATIGVEYAEAFMLIRGLM